MAYGLLGNLNQGLREALSAAEKDWLSSLMWLECNYRRTQYRTRKGINLSRFNYALDARGSTVLACALYTVNNIIQILLLRRLKSDRFG